MGRRALVPREGFGSTRARTFGIRPPCAGCVEKVSAFRAAQGPASSAPHWGAPSLHGETSRCRAPGSFCDASLMRIKWCHQTLHGSEIDPNNRFLIDGCGLERVNVHVDRAVLGCNIDCRALVGLDFLL